MYEICIWTNKPIIKEVVDHATSLEEAKSIIKGLIIDGIEMKDIVVIGKEGEVYEPK